MAASEAARLALHAAARAKLGEKEGDTLMAITAPANHDIATRQDIVHATDTLRAAMAAGFEVSEERTKAVVAKAANRILVQTIVVFGVFQAGALGYVTMLLR